MLGLIEIVGVSIDEVHRFSAQSGDSKSAQRISEPMHKYGRTQEAANRLERIASDFCTDLKQRHRGTPRFTADKSPCRK